MNWLLPWLSLAVLTAGSGTGLAYREAKTAIQKADYPSITLRIYNSEDYIANGEDDSRALIEEFKEKVLEEDHVNLTVSYSTFDTNEIMLSNYETGAQPYDLICTSDYMVERMMARDMLVPFATGDARKALYTHGYEGWEEDTYEAYGSPFLHSLYQGIQVKGSDGVAHEVNDYMRGYMWGTLGIMYNPSFSVYAERGLSPEQVKFDMADYASLWDKKYAGTFQIKDSMRDSYAIALLYAYREDFVKLLTAYQNGSLSEDAYNHQINILFNNISHVDEFNEVAASLGATSPVTDAEIIDTIQDALSTLMGNSYGLEVDSGKTDIQTGNRTGIDMAWSGDAVYAIESAEEYGTSLYYSVPTIGANIWLDAWVIPSSVQTQEYAQKFIDFLSTPEIAAANMDYIGYTSAVAGDSLLEQTREWYDTRMPILYQYDEEAEDFVRDENDELIRQEAYASLSEDEFNALLRTGHGVIEGETYDSWDDYSEKNDLGWTAVNLSYFFNDSLNDFQNDVDAVFYTDEYESITIDGKTITAGRAFYAQYPPEEIVPTLMVMEDYGEDNQYVLKMWENVKSGSVPPAVIVILVIEAAVILSVAIFFAVQHGIAKGLRKKRRAERNA